MPEQNTQTGAYSAGSAAAEPTTEGDDMDPEACLARCEAYLKLNWALPDVLDALLDYLDWRDKGGFEPKDGDKRARSCALAVIERITARTTRYGVL